MNTRREIIEKAISTIPRSSELFGDKTLDRLLIFSDTLLEWNSVHNLSGVEDMQSLAKNIADSLYPLSFVEKARNLLDIGTGAGFPGLLLASVWDDMECVLCEPIAKRSSFLRFCAMQMGLENVVVERKRVEELDYPPFSMISSRAVTDLSILLDICSRLIDDDTELLLYKGSRAQMELDKITDAKSYEIVTRGKRRYLYKKRAKR